MTDTDTDARRAVLRESLPGLEAANGALRATLQSLLSPAVVAALAAGAGPGIAVDTDSAAATARDASALLRDLDSQLPALRYGGGN